MKSRISMLVPGLAVVLAAHVGASAAATRASEATEGPPARGTVQIDLEGRVHGAQFRFVGEGRFIIHGAIQDRGTFRLRLPKVDGRGDPYFLTLSGAKGTIRVTGDGPNGGRRRQWRVTGGTNAYAGLRGWGRVQGYVNHSFALTMTGRVKR